MTLVDWHGYPAVQLENNQVQVVIVPELGAKIASLVDKTADHEWLAPPTHPVRPRVYGDPFTEHDLAGWDEMFPTIDPCPSPHDPAVMLPDHGEVWAQPWQGLDPKDTLHLSVVGKALPYHLKRSAWLEGTTLVLSYHAENLSAAPMPYLWAAHPLAAVDAHTQIVLPDAVHEVIQVLDNHDIWGAAGTRYTWPNATTADGRVWDLRAVGEATLHDCRKFYIPPESSIDWAMLRQRDTGAFLRLSWDKNALPYLGIWIDEGTYSRFSTIALEPTNGYFDALDRAYTAGRCAVLPPHGSAYWELQLTVGRGAEASP
ncbi:MAG: hypothetical protein ACOYL5_05265 [Phototrophicaceae bacterium]